MNKNIAENLVFSRGVGTQHDEGSGTPGESCGASQRRGSHWRCRYPCQGGRPKADAATCNGSKQHGFDFLLLINKFMMNDLIARKK